MSAYGRCTHNGFSGVLKGTSNHLKRRLIIAILEAEVELVLLWQMLHTRDKGARTCAVIRPSGEDFLTVAA